MSIRNLDWSPLDLDEDPVYTDPVVIAAAQVRYEGIATTIDDAVSKLGKIVDTNSDSLAGQYVAGLKTDATSLKDRLQKAGVRYTDVAREIKKYEEDLGHALTETAGARTDAETAVTAQTKANALPDAQKSSDGTLSPTEQQKADDKTKAVSAADTSLTAAKTRLTNALSALDVAGKRFGDAVNCKNYDDGLSDSWKDKLDAVMAKISQIFAIIGMVLAALAILIPGVDLIVFAGVVAGAVTLVANIVLYHDGKGSVLDVVLGVVGLGLAGAGAVIGLIGKGLASGAKTIASDFSIVGGRGDGIEMVPLRPPAMPNFSRPFGPGNALPPKQPPNFSRPFGANNPAGGTRLPPPPPRPPTPEPPPSNAATNWQNTSDWFNNPITNWLLGKIGVITPDIGFWPSAWNGLKGAGAMWGTLFTDPLKFGKDFASIIAGIKGAEDLSAVMAAAGLGKISPLWYVWGGLNGAFGFGAGFIYTGGRLQGWIPAVNPPGVVQA